MARRRRQFGFDVHANHGKGCLVATYRAFSLADVQRAVALEWGAEAATMKIARCPIALCYHDILSRDRFYDLTNNEGWASIMSAKEVEMMV